MSEDEETETEEVAVVSAVAVVEVVEVVDEEEVDAEVVATEAWACALPPGTREQPGAVRQ